MMNFAFGGSMSSQGSPKSNDLQHGWQEMTIKEILEKVDLFNITAMEEDKDVKEEPGKDANETLKVNQSVKPETAFLGPKVWHKPLSLNLSDEEDEDDDDFSVMNFEDFLTEHNIEVEEETLGAVGPRSGLHLGGNNFGFEDNSRAARRPGNVVKNADTSFLYAESKAAKLEREREEKRKAALKIQIDFSPEDLALATIPGMKFDPCERAFTVDELRPQPIIRKRKKSYVPPTSKDEKYWEKRIKNNVAARRSREARRLKENQISLRAAFLEKENAALREEFRRMTEESKKLEAEKAAITEKLKALRGKLGC